MTCQAIEISLSIIGELGSWQSSVWNLKLNFFTFLDYPTFALSEADKAVSGPVLQWIAFHPDNW